MSEAEANPDSSILMALRMNGMSRAFTTKPARSWQSMGRFPSPSTHVRQRSTVSDAVSKEGTSSTS